MKGEELRHGGVRSSQLKRKHWKKEGQRARVGRVRACVNAGWAVEHKDRDRYITEVPDIPGDMALFPFVTRNISVFSEN